MGQPPSDQALKCRVMLLVDTSMNLPASGIIGLEPFVRVFKMSEGSPVPILRKDSCVRALRRPSCACRRLPASEGLPVISRDVNLVSGTAPQVLEGVLLRSGANLSRFPVAKLGFVVDRVSVNRRVIGGMRAQFHRQGVGGSGGKGDLRRVRWSCKCNCQ